MSDDFDIEEHDVMDNPAIKKIFPDLSVIKQEIDIEEHDVMDNPAIKKIFPDLSVIKQEIDIEEHDVMDNPAIKKKIFPDLSVIKQEINQYFDEALNEPPETALEEECERDATTDSKIQLPYHIQSSIKLVTTNPTHASEDTETQNVSRYLHKNIIILGSKPNFEGKKSDFNSLRKEPRIIINNVNSFLNSCKRYCKKCFILFPNAKLFKLHFTDIHTKRAKNIRTAFIGKKLSNNFYKCNTCSQLLSSSSNLSRHYRNLHSETKTLKKVDISDKTIVANKASQSKVTTELSCFHCQLLFSTQSSLIEHLYEVLEPNKTGPSNKSERSSNSKETNEELNFNDRLIKDESVKDLNEFNVNDKNSLAANNSKPDTNIGNSESSLPRNNQRRRSLSHVGLVEYDDENIKKKKHSNIENTSPLQNQDSNTSVGLKTVECNDCNKQFTSKKKLEHHIRSMHTKISNNNKIKSKIRKEILCYRCFICSKYHLTFEFLCRHMMTDHNLKKVTNVKKVPFDSQCKFCPSKPLRIKSYNVHLYAFHYNKLKRVYHTHDEQPVKESLEKIVNPIQFALKSILFKCMKCDLFFFSSNEARYHSNHLKIPETWKCSICQRIFKRDNMVLHKKQHSFSQTFTVHTISKSTLGLVLYKCTNCTVHYSEYNFLLHYPHCDTETPDSLYCNVCDILINRDDMECHKVNHKEKNIQCCDFMIIESDMISDKKPKPPETKNRTQNRYQKQNDSIENTKYALNYCQTCKCFVGNVNLRKLHMEGKCGHMLKCACLDCGLMLTMKGLSTHKEYHKKEQLSLHDFLFYDIISKKRICPPIPDYPKCNSCGVHFLRNSSIKIHSCQEQDYISCNVCSMKLTEDAYKLHINFHGYSIQNEIKLKDTNLQSHSAKKISYAESTSNILDGSLFANIMFFYTCKSCELTVITYDKVVQHCQDHYDPRKVQLDVQKCQNCNLLLQKCDYDSHNKLHLNGKYINDSIKIVDFDPFYFCYNNEFWTKHIFAYVADEDISKILRTSIYRYECRLKMQETQSGLLNLVFYRCDKCQVIIDPQFMYMHSLHSGDKSCVKLRKHPCALCGIHFGSLTSRIAHEKEHEAIDMNLKSYKIITFNKEEDEIYSKIMYDANNRYVLYQCRNCERVVDKFVRNAHKCDENNLKICSTCGLVFDMHDFDLHFIRHEELDKFNAENIIIAMFGKLPNPGKKKLRSTFNGTKYDFTVYKCKECDLCLKTKKCISKHVCVFDDSKVKCSVCGLCFLKLDIKCHYEEHESLLYIDDLIMNIITFEAPSENLNDVPKPLVDPKDKIGDSDHVTQTDEIIENTSTSKNLEIVYKCENCGLHFLEKLSAQQHVSICSTRMKISKQSCLKCDMLFTPGELFNHLLKHHCDKELKFNFDIVFVSKRVKK